MQGCSILCRRFSHCSLAPFWQVFKLLRLLSPIIDFFSADDQTGLMNNWWWDRPARSAFIVLFMATLYKDYSFAIWSFFQVGAAGSSSFAHAPPPPHAAAQPTQANPHSIEFLRLVRPVTPRPT